MWQPSTRYPDPAIEILDPSFERYRVFSAAVERLTTNRLAFQREQMTDLMRFAKSLDETQRVEFLELVRTRLERGAMFPRRPEPRPQR